LGRIIAVPQQTLRFDGTFFNFNHAKCIVFDKEKLKYLATRIYGAAQKEVQKNSAQVRRVLHYTCLLL